MNGQVSGSELQVQARRRSPLTSDLQLGTCDLSLHPSVSILSLSASIWARWRCRGGRRRRSTGIGRRPQTGCGNVRACRPRARRARAGRVRPRASRRARRASRRAARRSGVSSSGAVYFSLLERSTNSATVTVANAESFFARGPGLKLAHELAEHAREATLRDRKVLDQFRGRPLLGRRAEAELFARKVLDRADEARARVVYGLVDFRDALLYTLKRFPSCGSGFRFAGRLQIRGPRAVRMRGGCERLEHRGLAARGAERASACT